MKNQSGLGKETPRERVLLRMAKKVDQSAFVHVLHLVVCYKYMYRKVCYMSALRFICFKSSKITK